MAGPSYPQIQFRWPLGYLAVKVFIRLPLLWLVLELLSIGASGHLIRSPNQSNQTAIPLSPQQPNFDSFSISGALYTPASKYVSLPSLPPSCATYNVLGGECPTYMLAVNVTYDDCADAWTMCHCSSANVTLDDAVGRLGRVPVGLRKYIATTVVLPGEETHAYSLTNGDLHMFGNCSMKTWIHEATHAYDYVFGEPISGSQAWLDAISADSCATDNYGTNNAVEELAQMSVLKIFSLIYGSLPKGWDASCMSNQLAFLDTLPLYDKNTLFANTCAATATIQNSSTEDFAAVRPIKAVGPSFDFDAPLRINPNASPQGLAAPSVAPMSVAQDPAKNSDEKNHETNSAPSRFINGIRKHSGFLFLCTAILLISGT